MSATTYNDRKRTLRYDHPTSVKRREEAAAGPQRDPVTDLRMKHRAQDAELGEKHNREMIALGHSPDRLGETREDRKRKLMVKHHTERRALTKRQGEEMRRAQEAAK